MAANSSLSFLETELEKLNLSKASIILSGDREKLEKSLSFSTVELLKALVPIAAQRSRCLVSKFQIGGVGLGETGNLYLGANVEFPGDQIVSCIHGEQCVIAQTIPFKDPLTAIAINASPCGHCRQFLNEQKNAEGLQVYFPSVETTLSALLPRSFGPVDLGSSTTMGNGPDTCDDECVKKWADEIAHAHPSIPLGAALAACRGVQRSHAPYTQSVSGVALVTPHGVISGSYLESAAYNPSLPALQAAIAQLVMQCIPFEDVSLCVLVEPVNLPFSSLPSGQRIALSAFPKAQIIVCALTPS